MSFGFVGLKGVVALALCLLSLAPFAASPDGRKIYNFRCYFCHGYSGDARTLAAQMLSPGPRDFTAGATDTLTRQQMIDAVTHGVEGTAMKPFSNLLDGDEIMAVVDFVRTEFMQQGAENTRYHTTGNGWPEHQRFSAAFPFVRGEISLSVDDEALSPEQRRGRTLYLRGCISCHDVAKRDAAPQSWAVEAVSYPRVGFATGDFLDPPDAFSGATTFARHDIVPLLESATSTEIAGEKLFQDNCAFCHAADGTGKNWIGTFMVPHPRDLTSRDEMRGMTRERLREVIRTGLPGTSMPAWGDVLSETQIHEITEYIGKVFHPSLRRD